MSKFLRTRFGWPESCEAKTLAYWQRVWCRAHTVPTQCGTPEHSVCSAHTQTVCAITHRRPARTECTGLFLQNGKPKQTQDFAQRARMASVLMFSFFLLSAFSWLAYGPAHTAHSAKGMYDLFKLSASLSVLPVGTPRRESAARSNRRSRLPPPSFEPTPAVSPVCHTYTPVWTFCEHAPVSFGDSQASSCGFRSVSCVLFVSRSFKIARKARSVRSTFRNTVDRSIAHGS